MIFSKLCAEQSVRLYTFLRPCYRLSSWSPRRHGCWGCTLLNVIFDKLIQILLHSKVTKAELYLIGGYHNEWLELTYCIETLHFWIEIDQIFCPNSIWVKQRPFLLKKSETDWAYPSVNARFFKFMQPLRIGIFW